MTTYVYKAKKKSAETVTGQISAQNQDEAVDLITQLGMLPVSIEEELPGKARDEALSVKKIKSKELYLFSRQLGNLLKAGVSLPKALTIIEQQTENLYFKKVIAHLLWQIKNGKSFSQALSQYPPIFSHLYVTMIKAGEESGDLEKMLATVVTYQKYQEETFSKLRMALAYPLFMAVMGTGTVIFILSFVLPKLIVLFQNVGEDLPMPTRILIALSQLFHRGWYVLLILLGSGIIGWQRLSVFDKTRHTFSRALLKIPLLGEMLLKDQLARFCRTLVMLLKSGISIVHSLAIAIPVINNEILKEQFIKCHSEITLGKSFGFSIKQRQFIPSMMGHLITVGEESGNLNEVLDDIADSYEQETNERLRILTTLLEPAMILVMGGIIGFIVFAMLLPIFQLDVMGH